MLGKSSWKTWLWEKEHRQRVKEAINEAILEGGLEVKEKEVMPLAIGDINLKEDQLETIYTILGHTNTSTNDHNICTTNRSIA